MRILGIDPGTAIVGYAVVDYENGKYVSKQYTKEEWKKLREYYESLEAPKKMGKKRWAYEIKR